MHEKGYAMSEVVAALVQSNGGNPTSTQVEPEPEEESSLAEEPLHVQAAFEFLGRKHCTLWADFLISDHHGRLRAARWLAAEMAGVEKILTSNWQPE